MHDPRKMCKYLRPLLSYSAVDNDACKEKISPIKYVWREISKEMLYILSCRLEVLAHIFIIITGHCWLS